MTFRFRPVTIAAGAVLATALVACGGGGSTGSSSPAVSTNPVNPTSPQSQSSIPMTFTFHRGTSGTAKRPSYLSNNTQSLALYDGATLVYVTNLELDSGNQFEPVYAASGSTSVTPGTCSFTEQSATCNVTVTTTAGAHTFDVVAYPDFQSSSPQPTAARRAVQDTPPTLAGVILSEGELSVTLVAGANPAKTLTLNGVAYQVLDAGAGEIAYNASSTVGFQIEEASGGQIVQPGGYDNGPITITSSPPGIVTTTVTSISTPPATMGDQQFDVKCVNPAGGDVTISFNAGTHPNTTYADGLTYSAANYATSPIATMSFTCDAEPATLPITVDAKNHHAQK